MFPLLLLNGKVTANNNITTTSSQFDVPPITKCSVKCAFVCAYFFDKDVNNHKNKNRNQTSCVHRNLIFKFYYLKFFTFIFSLSFARAKSASEMFGAQIHTSVWQWNGTRLMHNKTIIKSQKWNSKHSIVCCVNREKRKKFIHNNPLLVVDCGLTFD